MGQDISYLELAIYNGKYYVSFPPFPSVIMLPFVLIFGTDTPNNLIIMIITLLIAAAAFKLCSYAGYDAKDSAILGLFITFGSNLMWMSTMGGVWFLAQSIMMLLLLLAAIAAYKDRQALAMRWLRFRWAAARLRRWRSRRLWHGSMLKTGSAAWASLQRCSANGRHGYRLR